MLRRLANALSSSIGKKVVMGLTGLLLVGFLIGHLVGNLTLYADSDGAAFNGYVEKLESFGPLLLVAELALAALFLCHVFLAFRLTLENREARKARYVIRNNRGGQTLGSASMFVTGVLLLGYLIKHLIDFRFDAAFDEDPAGLVKATLSSTGNAVVYVAVGAVLVLHLSHGFRSAFQSLGASHPKLNPLLVGGGWLLAVALAVGFVSFPLYYLFFWSGGAQT